MTIPGSGTSAYPASVALYGRRGLGESPDGGVVYLRALDDAGSAIAGLLTDTSGTVLPASSASGFPSSAGWRAAAESSVQGVFDFEFAVASAASATRARLEVGYRTEGEPTRATAAFALAGSATVDLSSVTTPLGAWGDIEDDETLFGAIAGVKQDVAGISTATVESLIGTPAATVSGDIAAAKAVIGDIGGSGKTIAETTDPLLLAYGLVTTAGGTGTVIVADFIGRDIKDELLIIEDVSSSLSPKLRSSRTVASFNNSTGACTVAALTFSPAVGDRVWIYPRAQTGP